MKIPGLLALAAVQLLALPARAENLAPPQTPLTSAEESLLLDTLAPGAPLVPLIDISLARRALVGGSTTLRAYAAAYFAKCGTWDDLPYLIDTLSDDSGHVGASYIYPGMACTRYWANVSLIAITHLDMGYRWDDPPDRRDEAIACWKQQWTSYLANKNHPHAVSTPLIEYDDNGTPVRAPGLPVGLSLRNPYTGQTWTIQPDHTVTAQPSASPR